MQNTAIGLFAGLLLGLALILGNFGDMLIVALFGAIGVVVVRVLESDVDFSQFTRQKAVTVVATAPIGAVELNRGITSISSRVVAKIAVRAAADVPRVFPPPSTGLSRLPGRSQDLDATAEISGTCTRIVVRLGVAYPTPVVQTGREVERIIRARVEQLTGLTVTAVRVEVLTTILPPTQRRVE